MTTLNN